MTDPTPKTYDPDKPRSFCQKCLKLDWTRKRAGRWLCERCTRQARAQEQAAVAARAESLKPQT